MNIKKQLSCIFLITIITNSLFSAFNNPYPNYNRYSTDTVLYNSVETEQESMHRTIHIFGLDQSLRKRKAALAYCDIYGYTALDIAAIKGNWNAVAALVQLGATYNQRQAAANIAAILNTKDLFLYAVSYGINCRQRPNASAYTTPPTNHPVRTIPAAIPTEESYNAQRIQQILRDLQSEYPS